ncbi:MULTISPECIES: hypothetical protein [Nostocales]|uniref:CRISPR type III-B/RAMP module-associated protein Cmr5 n=3 Tax=Nostocales TaxID=1161 RepID=A0A0C1QPI9_9CYAN|nr:hypothetical protein [Tolypothrix bouteillei]KAF3889083.1 hypothetical protein DA73_0400029085 [Tolypothrix bouteillei VB521301]
MTNWEEQQKEFKIQKGIRDAEDDLVIAIEERLNNQKSYGKLEDSQYRNLMHVADTTGSIAVIKNFLRYQLGRDKKWGEGKESLAEKIIDDIDDKLKQKALEIIEKSGCNETEKIEKIKPVWLELTRRYLSYGSRHLKYLNPSKSTSPSKTN